MKRQLNKTTEVIKTPNYYLSIHLMFVINIIFFEI